MKNYCIAMARGALALLFFILLQGCGGGGGGGDDTTVASNGGIGGTGFISQGAIDGFGSIFVNGIEFETDTAEIELDGANTSDSALRLGMVVTVTGTVNSDGLTGNATSVRYNDEVQGPLAGLTTSADGNQHTFTVLGVAVIADSSLTVFDDVSFSTLSDGDLVEVSGFYNSANELAATRIEKKEDFVSGSSEIELKGVVSSAAATSFVLGTYTVNYSGADLSDIEGGVITDGLFVEVKGTLTGLTITASEVSSEDDLFDDANNEDIEVNIEGLITDYVSAANFKVAGQLVNANGADLSPSSLVLGNNVSVEVEGQIVNGVLIADEVESEDGEIELGARVESVDAVNKNLTLRFFSGTLVVYVDNQTRIDDDTDVEDVLTLSEISAGDYLEVNGYLNNASQIVASEIKRDEAEDHDMLQGKVDSFTSGSQVTVLGLTYTTTAGTDFENANDQSIDSSTFYAALSVGSLIKIEDKNATNGVADEIEYETD